MKQFRRFTLFNLLSLVTIFAIVIALWFTPVEFTFHLRGTDVRTSANVGDLIDLRKRDDWEQVFIHKAEITKYVREGNVSLGTDVDVVTVKTTLFNKIRLSFYDDFSGRYYDP